MRLNRNNGHTTSALVSSSSPNENKTQSIRRVRKAGSALIIVRGLRRRGRGIRNCSKFADKKYIFCGKRGGRGIKSKNIVDVIYGTP